MAKTNIRCKGVQHRPTVLPPLRQKSLPACGLKVAQVKNLTQKRSLCKKTLCPRFTRRQLKAVERGVLNLMITKSEVKF